MKDCLNIYPFSSCPVCWFRIGCQVFSGCINGLSIHFWLFNRLRADIPQRGMTSEGWAWSICPGNNTLLPLVCFNFLKNLCTYAQMHITAKWNNPCTRPDQMPPNTAQDHFVGKPWADSGAFLVCAKLRRPTLNVTWGQATDMVIWMDLSNVIGSHSEAGPNCPCDHE